MAKNKEEAAEGTVSKMEAVRQTLAAGIEKPQEAIAHIKEKFGLDVPAVVFSTYKSVINAKKGSTPGKRGRKAGSANGRVASMAATADGNFTGSGIQLALEVKALVGRYGADAVKGMADVFAN